MLRVYGLRFRQLRLVTYFQQDAPQFRKTPLIIEVPVHAHVPGHDLPDTVGPDKGKDPLRRFDSVKFHVPASCSGK